MIGGEFDAALGKGGFEIVQAEEVLVDDDLVERLPEMLGWLQFGL